MKRVIAKFVLKLLTFVKNNGCVSIAQELLNDIDDDPDLLKRA
jgi:hypothetical protein